MTHFAQCVTVANHGVGARPCKPFAGMAAGDADLEFSMPIRLHETIHG
jgi:hypothetical protein